MKMKMLLIPTLVLSLAACSTVDSDGEKDEVDKKDVEEIVLKDPNSNQKGDFLVSAKTKGSTVIANLTYIGTEDAKKISHGSNIFRINVKQKDGNFEYMGVIGRSYVETFLEKEVSHTFELDLVKDLNAPKGTYEVEIHTEFSDDKGSVEIPVSIVVEIN